jgi:hypothetical protein
MKHIPTADELVGVQKECFELLKNNQEAIDDNTEWCLAFWKSVGNDCDILPEDIRKYPPESLTKYRRNLVEWGLIFPSEKSKKHSREKEAENHKKDYQFSFHNETMDALKKLTILPDEHGQNQLFKTFNKIN